MCITFDDGLKCQYDIALPVLKKHNLTAFWFIYTLPVSNNKPVKLELYRHFRSTKFKNIDDFYSAFREHLLSSKYRKLVQKNLQLFDAKTHLREYPFYTENDKEFRFIRDEILGRKKYEEIMDELVAENTPSLHTIWMDKKDISLLTKENHVIGLHSHTHPTSIATLPEKEQRKEYILNFKNLKNLTGDEIKTVSHPCGSYSDKTLKILQKLNIKIGFRDNMKKINYSNLEFPRFDHTYLLKKIR